LLISKLLNGGHIDIFSVNGSQSLQDWWQIQTFKTREHWFPSKKRKPKEERMAHKNTKTRISLKYSRNRYAKRIRLMHHPLLLADACYCFVM
jgi:hypothetical protein